MQSTLMRFSSTIAPRFKSLSPGQCCHFRSRGGALLDCIQYEKTKTKMRLRSRPLQLHLLLVFLLLGVHCDDGYAGLQSSSPLRGGRIERQVLTDAIGAGRSNAAEAEDDRGRKSSLHWCTIFVSVKGDRLRFTIRSRLRQTRPSSVVRPRPLRFLLLNG